MSLVERILKRIYTEMTDESKDLYLPKIFLGNEQVKAILSQDRKGIGLPKPLSGACNKGTTLGNATLDLLAPKFSLATIHGAGFNAQAAAEYTGFDFSITASGPRVPAHPQDFCCCDGSKVGPTSLAGISDFSGPKLEGTFNCFQECTVGGTVKAPGRFIATLNNVTLSMKGKLYIPAVGPMTVSIDSFSIAGIEEQNMTLTLLHENGSLPVYTNNYPDDDVSYNFYMAQGAINCPPLHVPSVFATLADLYKSSFTANYGSILESMTGGINDVIKDWL